MNNKILLQDLIDGLAARSGVAKKDAEAFVRAFFAQLEDSLRIEKLVKVKGLGTFKLVDVSSRESVNVNTGERFMIDGHSKISFTPDNSLRDLINKPFADFETVILNDSTSTEDMERIDVVDEPDVDTSEAEEESPVKLPVAPEEVAEEQILDANVEEVEEISIHEQDVTESQNPESSDPVASNPESEEPEHVVSSIREEIAVPQSDEPADSHDEPADEAGDSEEPAPMADAVHNPVQSALVQHVGQQQIEELNVASQHVEHQTIEQKTVNPKERSGLRLGWGSFILLLLVTIALMVASYVAGHFDVLSFTKDKNVSVPSVAAAPAVKSDTNDAATKPVLSAESDSISSSLPIESQAQAAEQQAEAGEGTNPVRQVDDPKYVQKTNEAKPEQKPAASKAEVTPVTVKPETKQTSVTTEPKPSNSQPDSTSKDSSLRAQNNNSSYPQLSKGKYTIVGVKATHTLKSGETLLKLSRTYYNGSNDYANYIMIMNNIKNPDVVPEGAVLKIPELAPKE